MESTFTEMHRVGLSRRAFLELSSLAVAGLGLGGGARAVLAAEGASSELGRQSLGGTEVAGLSLGSPEAATLAEFVESYAPVGSGLALNRKIRVVFVESSVSGDSIDPGTVQLLVNGSPAVMQPYFSGRQGNREFRCVPFPFWQAGKQYSVVIKAGVQYGKSHEQLASDVTWVFSTTAQVVQESFVAGVTPGLSNAELAIIQGAGSRFAESDLVKSWQDPSSSLYEISQPVDPFDPEVVSMGEKMIASLTPLGAIGLAAPQLGVNRRMFAAQTSGVKKIFVNPVLVDWAEELYMGSAEGCLSIDSLNAKVNRPVWVTMKYQNAAGQTVTETFQNDNAKVVLHEYDHVNGILMLDRQQDKRFGSTSNNQRQGLVPITPLLY